MADKTNRENDVTIVGGRPMRRMVDVTELPQGVEQVLTLAALSRSYREAVAKDPLNAAASKGILLDPIEADLLKAIPPKQIAAMAKGLIKPPGIGRRKFIKTVSASVAAMITGSGFLLCSGCTGEDGWESDTEPSDPEELWINLSGFTCYVYLPRGRHPGAVSADSLIPGTMVALHDENETCLASAQRWRTAADNFGFAILAVCWDENTTLDIEDTTLDGLVIRDMLRSFHDDYGYDEMDILSGRGRAADISFELTFRNPLSPFGGLVLLGGYPGENWNVGGDDPIFDFESYGVPAPLYYVIGKNDPEYDAAVEFNEQIRQYLPNLAVSFQALEGTTTDAALNFSNILEWLMDQQR